MVDEPTEPDLEKARLILSEFGLLIGPAGEKSDIITRAIAAGIALGRKEALWAEQRPWPVSAKSRDKPRRRNPRATFNRSPQRLLFDS
jgi:hypothetical protein